MSTFLSSINPYDLSEINKYPVDEASAIHSKLDAAQMAFEKWSQVSIRQRRQYLKSLSDYLLKNKYEMAALASLEMGKPIAQSLAELDKSAHTIKFYAEHAEHFLEDEMVETEAQKSFVTFQPLGVVLAIMPWNYPFWQVFRAMGPILMAGNTMLLKHASNVTGCALAIQNALVAAGLPQSIFQTLVLPSSQMESIIAHPFVKAVTFTGSSSAGKKVAALAAANLKKQVLELGGSDAYIILEDADLRLATELCVHSRLNNTGQSCICAKRFIVVKEIAETFTNQVVQLMEKIHWADPMNAATQMGPMARMDLRDELHQQVLKSIAMGATILCGGFIPEEKGAFYPASVLSNVKKGMPAYDEELFGPVASIIIAENEDEAIRIANDTPYGLGGGIFSRDTERAEKIAVERFQSGSVFINNFVSSDVRLPFGGIKESGYGRELSYYGLREFVNIKTVSIK